MQKNIPLTRSTNKREEILNEKSEIISGLLKNCRAQWQRGDWESLSQLRESMLRTNPNRVELAILVAIANLQHGNFSKANNFFDISMKWGAGKKVIGRLLVSSSYISLSRAANLSGDKERSLYFFEKAIHAKGEYFQKNTKIILDRNSEFNQDVIFSREVDNVKIKNQLLLGKRVLIVLWFRNLSGGGLHENVRDTANSIRESSGEPIVICPRSRFAEELIASGIRVIQVDYEILGFEKTIHDCLANYDLVHCHPGPSRIVGVKLAEMANCPLVMTIHGGWDDGISTYVDKVDAIVVVSQFIRDSLINKIPHAKSKILLIPNGVDASEFGFDDASKNGDFFASFVGRIDVDKKDGIDLLTRIWEKQASKELPSFKWKVAGDGPLLSDLKERSRKIFNDDKNIEYLGWLDREALANLLYETNFVIAAGRSGSEALVSGCSTILSGREGFMLIRNWKNFTNAVYSNFGGYGSQFSQVSFDEVMDFVNECFSSFDKKSTLSKNIISQYIKKYYNKDDVGEKMIYQYAGLIMGR